MYAWRPIELIHPVLYASLVRYVTQEEHWKTICTRFSEFASIPRLQCLSLPVESLTDQSDRAEQISGWWSEVEQKSIELSLEHEFLIRTDIVDCYASLYTHSIAWALHGKQVAKCNTQEEKLIGNVIDWCIQDMHQGQTNGIPQGSKLMDLIAEMVLGYADTELATRLKHALIKDYQILRYRDDYRIFVNTRIDGEVILKNLTEVMFDLGLKLNPYKTDISNEVIRSSIKDDKLGWMFRRQSDHNLERHLLIIYDHSKRHPNSGSVEVSLKQFHKRISKITKKPPNTARQLISIVADIAYHNPRTYPVSAAILSNLLNFFESPTQKVDVINKILKKFARVPNTGHLEIWLQRISHKFGIDIDFTEPLCKQVNTENGEIWNSNWISSKDLRLVLRSAKIVDQDELEKLGPVIPPKEIELFHDTY